MVRYILLLFLKNSLIVLSYFYKAKKYKLKNKAKRNI